MKNVLITSIFFLSSIISWSQNDTVGYKKLKQVTVTNQRVLPIKTRTIGLDSVILHHNESRVARDILQWHSHAFIKNYGPSNLSTISIRGSSAAQTQVTWNGLPLNSASTGITDLSLLPIGLFDKLQISYSGINQLGGAVLLNDKEPAYNSTNSLSLNAGYESLRNSSLLLKQQSSGNKWMIQNKVLLHQAQNTFPFYNNFQESNMQHMHAQQQQINLLSSLYRALNKQNDLSFHIWYQRNDRNLPPTLFEDSSRKTENTSNIRTSIQWKKEHTAKKFSIHSLLGFIHEKYTYADSILLLNFNAGVINIPFSFAYVKRLHKHRQFEISAFGHTSILRNESNSSLQQGGIKLGYQSTFGKDRITMSAFLQKEVSNIFNLPIAAGLLSEYRYNKYLEFFLNIKHNYRAPTLNELYFFPGGNPKLKPETGLNTELGVILKSIKPRSLFKNELLLYRKQVENWIVWYGNSILTPHNVLEVNSRGLEWSVQYEQLIKYNFSQKYKPKHNELRFVSRLLYAYTLATTENSAIKHDFSTGKQLPYVPRYQAKSSIGFLLRNFGFHHQYLYTGYRFTTTDESEYLKPFSVHNISGNYTQQSKQFNFTWGFSIQNILNENYEGVQGRILPTRNYSLTLTISQILSNCKNCITLSKQ